MGAEIPSDIRAEMDRARALARTLEARHPGLRHYPYVLGTIDRAEGASDAKALYEALRPLGVFAVREFDGAEGEYAALADAIFAMCYAAERASR